MKELFTVCSRLGEQIRVRETWGLSAVGKLTTCWAKRPMQRVELLDPGRDWNTGGERNLVMEGVAAIECLSVKPEISSAGHYGGVCEGQSSIAYLFLGCMGVALVTLGVGLVCAHHFSNCSREAELSSSHF